MKHLTLGLCLLGMASQVACGNGDDGGGSGGTDSGGSTASGGDSSTGGAGNTTGGAPGSGGSPGTGGQDGGAHCSPGTQKQMAFAYPPLKTCRILGDGGGDRTLALETPIGPGDTYAFSANMGGSNPSGTLTMEVWGTDQECGEGIELLATDALGPGIRCLEVSPQNGTYSHLLWIWSGSAGHDEVTFCPQGSCE